jgi:hypothetical protein
VLRGEIKALATKKHYTRYAAVAGSAFNEPWWRGAVDIASASGTKDQDSNPVFFGSQVNAVVYNRPMCIVCMLKKRNRTKIKNKKCFFCPGGVA